MGKSLVVFGFLITLLVAAVVFLTRGTETPQDLLANDRRDPRIILDDFSFYRYSGPTLISNFSAKLGHFFEPNIIEVYAAVRGVRYNDNQVETLRCEAGSAILAANSMNELFRQKDVGIVRSEIEEQVRIGIGENIVRTDYAQYLANEDLVFSREPVEVDGPNRKFYGDKGFRYQIKSETLEVQGNVRGEFKPNDPE